MDFAFGDWVNDILKPLQNHPKAARIFVARQGSADDAGQKGPLGGADAGLRQKDRCIGMVLKGLEYTSICLTIVDSVS